MKTGVLVLALLALGACRKTEPPTPRNLSRFDRTAASAQKTYTMNGKLVSRDAAKKAVTIDNEEVPGGVMPPMTMAYDYRGDVSALPADGSKITSTLHEENGKYWVTDVKPRQ
ncbi:MAG TPA: copper-binding protein [Thermoanaerobaculia bacterium]